MTSAQNRFHVADAFTWKLAPEQRKVKTVDSMNITEISNYLEERINKCYKEEKENYGNDLKGKFISCEISGDFLIINYEEVGKIKKCPIHKPEGSSFEHLYYCWQVYSYNNQ